MKTEVGDLNRFDLKYKYATAMEPRTPLPSTRSPRRCGHRRGPISLGYSLTWRRQRKVFLAGPLALLSLAITTGTRAEQPVFVQAQPLPAVLIDGQPVKIHTQGLFVTDSEYIVTGRVDTLPRRPVLLSFHRENPDQYQVLSLQSLAGPQGGLDHPGGFDRDADGLYWIPLSTSHPLGPTKIIGMALPDGQFPADASAVTRIIEISDHLGAVCCLPNRRLLAANWDTRRVYVIDAATGEIVETYRYEQFFGDSTQIQLAVQDWKYDPLTEQIVAGGLDKSPARPSDQPAALMVRIDPATRAMTTLHRLPSPAGVRKGVTNEGLAVRGNRLYLLPEDIGRGAQILSYRVTPGSP